MAAQVENLAKHLPRHVLQADGIIELIVGSGLLLTSETVAHWIGVSAAAVSISAVVTLTVGIWLVYISRRNVPRRTLQIIAFLNLAGVIIIGFVLVLNWSKFANEGRWLLALVADTFLVLGLAERYAQRNSI